MTPDGFISYQVGEYSKNHTLVIDPPLSLAWATFYGGSLKDWAYSVKCDHRGNLYVVGETRSSNFPLQDAGGSSHYQGTFGGSSDIFIIKFNPQGVRLWATYYGGSASDVAYSVDIDREGNVYIVGSTLSSDFPVYNPGNGAFF